MSDQASTDARSRFDGVILVLAILLIAAPWLLGYSGDRDATATSLVAGLAICACVISTVSDYTRAFREIDMALGVLTAAAPLFFRFGGDRRAIVAHLLVGGAVTLISAGELLAPKHQPQQAHAFWHFWDDKQ
jgi:hypothetical protein